jgi:hypothetical protein
MVVRGLRVAFFKAMIISLFILQPANVANAAGYVPLAPAQTI